MEIEDWDSLQAYSVHKIIEGAMQLGWDIALLADDNDCKGIMIGVPNEVREIVAASSKKDWIVNTVPVSAPRICDHVSCAHQEDIHDDEGCTSVEDGEPCFCPRTAQWFKR